MLLFIFFFFFLPQIPDLKKGDGDSLQTGERDGREAIEGEPHSVWCLASHITKFLAPLVKD